MEEQANADLWRLVKLGFRLQGSCVVHWCEARGVNRRVARSACVGERNGPGARRLRRTLYRAAKVEALIASGLAGAPARGER